MTSNNEPSLFGMLFRIAVAFSTLFVFLNFAGAGLSSDVTTTAEGQETIIAFSEASAAVAKLIPIMFAGVIGVAVFLGVAPIAVSFIRGRKQYSLTTFGERRYIEHYEKSDKTVSDKRCLNCSKPLSENGGVKNVAQEWQIIAGFKTSLNHRIETFECHECYGANWFDYAMRSGEFDHELTDPEEISEEVETENSQNTSESNETQQSDGPECPICGDGPFKNEHGLNVHIGQVHPDRELRDGVVCLKSEEEESDSIPLMAADYRKEEFSHVYDEEEGS